MNACIFAGPTLPPHDEARARTAVWLPPAKHGDVYRAVTLLRPRAIGIVDGYFQWAPSVWHKEILWAMHQGVHVFGAASMGALRAAELAAFGMRGVGRIFEGYRDGVLAGCGDEAFEDDDEVAVIHGPAESGYVAASEAMVNIRCTRAAAARADVIAGATRPRLVAIAKAAFFPERSYELLLKHARALALPEDQVAALEAWLPLGRVNQKRVDAVAMLDAMSDFLARDPAPAEPGFAFEYTTLWARAVAGVRPTAVHEAEDARVLDELRLEGVRWDALWREALHALIVPVAETAAPPGQLARRMADRRREPHEIESLLEEAARMEAVRRMREDLPPAIVERQILARIRGTAEYEHLRARAVDKFTQIAARADLPVIEDFSDLQLLELRDWYFSRLLGLDMPDDIEQYVAAWNYVDLAEFHRAIFAEYVYLQMTGAPAAERAGAGG